MKLTRNQKGALGFMALSIALGILAEVIMLAREYYQYKHYHFKSIEWDDVWNYTCVIIVGCVFHYTFIAAMLAS